MVKAFLKAEKRKDDKSGCISYRVRKYEASVICIGSTVDIANGLVDTDVLTAEDRHFGTAFQIREFVSSEHTAPRSKLPESMTAEPPLPSRLQDEKTETL